jgi:hypothetical protein
VIFALVRNASICITYKAATYRGYSRHLFQLGSRGWTEITAAVHPSSVCGATTSLGTFAIFAKTKHYR